MDNYGWVQNTSNLSTIRETIDLVPKFGIRHKDLREKIAEYRISNGGLPKSWTWDARCRIKAVQALGLVTLDRNIQGYKITDLGLELQNSKKSEKVSDRYRILSDEEIQIFRRGLLTNPPVIRVLSLLNNERKDKNEGMNKYEIGSQLGFVGDPGFTHIDPYWVVANKASFNDKEGDSDKWARTIISWLKQVNWVVEAEIPSNILGKPLKRYKTLECVNEILRYKIKSVMRNVPSEMLCSAHHPFKDIIQKKRCILLEALSQKDMSINVMLDLLKKNNIQSNESELKYEIINLKRAGFQIYECGEYYRLLDKINLDINPKLMPELQQQKEDSIEDFIKQHVVQYESTIPTRLVDNLIRYGYNGKYGIEFETTVAEYFRFLGYETEYLGEGRGRVADVIAKYKNEIYAKSYALIIDAKATSSKYSFPVADVRKMKEYVLNHGRELLIEQIPNHVFSFVSTEFIDNVTKPIEEIYNEVGVKGVAIKVLDLLKLGDEIVSHRLKIMDIFDMYTTNGIFSI
jgi:hypothetical protein